MFIPRVFIHSVSVCVCVGGSSLQLKPPSLERPSATRRASA